MMAQKVMDGLTPPATNDDRSVSQVIFVLVGLGIIAAGLWSLYMSDAPYHPEIVSSDAEIYLASD